MLALGALVFLLFGSIGLTALDPIGVTRYVPDAQEVKQVTLSRRGETALLTEDADIEAIIGIHKAQIGNQNKEKYTACSFTIEYTLNNGREVTRDYNIILTPATKNSLNDIFSRWETVFPTKDWQDLYAITKGVSVNGYDVPKEEIEPLIKAISLDCDNGNMAQLSVLREEYEVKMWVDFYFKDTRYDGANGVGILIFSDCENALPLLEKYDEKQLLD